MIPFDFEYHRPSTMEEALKLLGSLEEAEVLSGGTDLLVDFKKGAKRARHVISITGLDELRIIEQSGDEILIGAAATHTEISRSELIKKILPDVSEAAFSIGAEQIRNAATIGGNICTAASCADMAPPLLARNARVELQSAKGARRVSLEDFFTGPRTTSKKSHEIITRIIVSKPAHAGSRIMDAGAFVKFGLRDGSAIAVASVAACLRLGEDKVEEARIALGAVSPVPMVAQQAGEFLKHKTLNEDTISEAARLASKESKPISDVRGSDTFRYRIVEALTRRAIYKALNRV